MNSKEAQEILLRCRPGTADEDDPQVAAALEWVRRDPELAQWWNDNRALHLSLRAKFKQIPVPVCLKEQILSKRPAPRVNVWWRNPAVLAAAASVVLLIGIASLWLRPSERDSISAYRRWMVRTALRTYAMDLETNDLKQIRSYLGQRNAHADFELRRSLEQAQATGCVVLSWHGKRVSMLCFRSGQPLHLGEKSDLFFFVMDRSSLPGLPAAGPPEFAKINKLMTASWSQGNKVYLLAGNGDEAFIRKFQ